ncbi:hypothetical protein FB565_000339 [Actinoplanes lutulentus]|uniref:Uncharacterized protein n=1 Tax=Actinoplanes lutulentus TaxID=1287878 RepID=A0A327ZLN7_9ACTN|nr:hypothetical protein [Actinoplanes lutulentus]MBB2940635.1 hypothetical protein [Actinoplanes lutulentus]RAK42946.1 hypothetical protein B0I29_10176 [Actinoplanes lutulentus]
MAVFTVQDYHQIRHTLFKPTRDYVGVDWGRDVLAPWVAANRGVLDSLHRIGAPEMATASISVEDSWALYALSRVAEVLILSSQPEKTADDADPDPLLPPRAYEQFITGIGGRSVNIGSFHPFLHEITDVASADNSQAQPELVASRWPACFVGSMLLLRGGVTVRAGADRLDPQITTESTLYWAWHRQYRPVSDLSHGWGSNSQWRTRFRRDYWLADRLAYNVDAVVDPRAVSDADEDQRDRDVDLLRYRCSTLVDHGADAWVWDSHHTEPTPFAL